MGKLKTLRRHQLQEGLWLVEYTQGSELLYLHLRASLSAGERLFVHPVDAPDIYSSARAVHEWVARMPASASPAPPL